MVTPAEPRTSIPADQRPAVPVTDAERSAIEITSLSLDLHIAPAGFREEAHTTITVRNRGAAAVTRIPLQLSSTLHWLSASASSPTGVQPIPFTQSPITTDTDHTGYAEEAIFTPTAPLAAGASLTLSVFYGGEIKRSGDRLELIGAPHDRALNTDWDEIAPTTDGSATALRGFGNVLWYPVSAPAAAFETATASSTSSPASAGTTAASPCACASRSTTLAIRPTPPSSTARFSALTRAPDTDDQVIDQTHGLATADFSAAPVGFRTPSLFLTAQQAETTPDQTLTVISPQMDVAQPYAVAAANLKPVVAELLGETPRSSLVLLDHAGEPFEDGSFLVAQLSAAAEPKAIAPRILPALTHAWMSPQSRIVPASSLWIDQGLPEFMSLVWAERSQGLEAAIGELRHAAVLLALADSDPATNPQPLTSAYADAFLRLKIRIRLLATARAARQRTVQPVARRLPPFACPQSGVRPRSRSVPEVRREDQQARSGMVL